MTKSIKKIFAALLVVATLALMIPFSASADATGTAGNYKLTLTISGSDEEAQAKAKAFSFKLYRLADINTTSGKVTYVSNTDKTLQNHANAAVDNASSGNLLKYCDGLATAPGEEETSYGWTPAKGTDGKYETSKTITIKNAGIYYVRSQGTGSLAQGAIVTLPLANDDGTYTNDYTADLAKKINSSPVSVTKKIEDVNGSTTNVKEDKEVASASVGDNVKFVLTATVPGSNNIGNKVKYFEIFDKMKDTELQFNKDAVVTYSVDGGTTYEAVPTSDYTVTTPSDAAFGIKFDTDAEAHKGYINPKYYGATIKVEFTAKVLSGAKLSTEGSNDNTDYLKYTNEADKTEEVPGNRVQVFTFQVGIAKVDANDTSKALANAEFKLYKTKADATADTDAIASGKTGTNGKLTFNAKLGAGIYYVKEINAPSGYVLDSTPHPVTITAGYTPTAGSNTDFTAVASKAENDGVVYLQVTNTKITVPSTGGMGTTIFTICGASLIVLAGVMFVVLKKKKTSK